MTDQFIAALSSFTLQLTQMWNEGASPVNLSRCELEYGKRYVRVVRADVNGSSRSAYAFIDIGTGDILKPASWKAPAKGYRGNIFGTEPLSGCGKYGVASLR